MKRAFELEDTRWHTIYKKCSCDDGITPKTFWDMHNKA
jgi:hypothetical protein